MNSFEYASPKTEAEAVELLNDHGAQTAVLAGGTDLMNLLKRDLLAPERVVDIKNVESMRRISADGDDVLIGSLATLEEISESPLLADYRSLIDVVEGIHAIQLQSNGTLGGDLCHLPNCWYYRNGYGLLGMDEGQSLVEAGDNRYHAIFGNRGPAKFVSASRFAPALIAWGASVRIIGPHPQQAETVPLEYFYVTPKTSRQPVTVLEPGQLISHIRLPDAGKAVSASYEVLEMKGLDWPLASAAASLSLDGEHVRESRIVMGHVAPIPWISQEASDVLRGKSVNEVTAQLAGDAAVAAATPLSGNDYKVQIARTAVKRAILRAAGLLEGGV